MRFENFTRTLIKTYFNTLPIVMFSGMIANILFFKTRHRPLDGMLAGIMWPILVPAASISLSVDCYRANWHH